ncbi:MAG: MFS transporter [Candidatus Polarisedimenticolaceae bacterium]|nr:MFS transporter [Candidatus Polarisedimenticolaceae bacterium]
MDKLTHIKGFIPFVAVIFLNAMVDLGHKIIVQNTVFKIYDGTTQVILTAIVNSLILLPFILLYTPSGYLADRFRKPRIMQITAAVAVVLTLLITLCYYQGWFELAFAMTFLLAAQSAIYSPSKYGYIREIAGKDRLARANGVVQAATIVAILTGIFLFSILFETMLAGRSYSSEAELIREIAPVGWILVACMVLELIMALRVPTLEEPTAPPFDWSRYLKGGYLKSNLTTLWEKPTIWLSIIGLAVFWGVSQVVLATFPAYAKEHLEVTNTIIIQGLLACSGLGIVIGSLIAGKVSDRYIETGLIPIGAMGIVITLGLITALPSLPLLGINILFFGIFGGLFIIPLNALIQFHAREAELGTVLAGNNLIQNIVMLGLLGMTVLFAFTGFSSTLLLNLVALVALVGTLYTLWRLPQSLIRYLVGLLFTGIYRIRVEGFHNMPSQGAVLLLGNHISWLDWAMVQMASPRSVHFVMHRKYYELWYLKWFLDLFGVVPIERGRSKESLATVNQLLKQGKVVCLFPEGGISRSGQLGQFKHGFERAVEGVDGVILPFYLRGLWGSRFSRASLRLRKQRRSRKRREIIVAFGEPISINSKAEQVKRAVFDLSIDAWQSYTDTLPPLPLAWIRRCKRHSRGASISEAGRGGRSLTRRQALVISLGYAQHIRRLSSAQQVGLLLPVGYDGLLANMAVLMCGKTVVNLQADRLDLQLAQAGVKEVITAEQLALPEGVQPIMLPQLQSSHLGKAIIWAATFLPASLIYRLFGRPVTIDDPAAIIFSQRKSGLSGVVLSQKNIHGNIKQVSDVLDTRRKDIVLATLPLSHAFGLTVSGLLPLIEGIHVVTHPDPTDVLTLAKAISKKQISLLCSSPALLQRYLDHPKVHPLMLKSLRLVVSGDGMLAEETRYAFSSQFNKIIYEGYGTSETTPVATINIPDRIAQDDWQVQTGHKVGSVGQPLPGSSIHIVDPVTLEPLAVGEEGLILVGGTQVMQGYLNDPEGTATVIIEKSGRRWYKSGDYGRLDSDGFLFLKGTSINS